MFRRIFHIGRHHPTPGEDVRLELEHHLEQSTRDFERQGLPPEEARRAALAAFGDRAAVEAELRGLRQQTLEERQSREWWSELRQDLQVAWRGLRRTPGFTLVALLTLALGIGANSAIFGVVRSVLLRPLPYPEPGQLVQLWTDYSAQNGRAEPEWLTPPDFTDWRAQNRSFSGMAAYDGWGPDLTGEGDPVALGGLAVGGDYFSLLGVAPALGRTLTTPDDDPGSERAVVLSHGLWQRQFGGDPRILGRTLQLSGEPWTVVGVMPRDFRAPVQGAQPEIFRARRRPSPDPCGRGCITVRAIGRLKPGLSIAQAQSDLGGIAGSIAERFPETNKGVKPWLIPLAEQLTGATRKPLLALSGAIGFVLLIACVNLASLLLVRGEGRARELAVRAALGAGRGRLVRQLVVESSLLALLGGALGLAVGGAGARLLGTIVPPEISAIQGISFDLRAVVFTGVITVLAGVLFGVAPALQTVAGSLMSTIRAGGREGGRHTHRALHALVIAEVALAAALLIGAGLLIRSFERMQRVELGYRGDGVTLVSVGFPRTRYPDSTLTVTVNGLLDRVRANPAVKGAEVTDIPPLNPGDQDVTAIAVGEPQPAGQPGSVWYRKVTPGYRALMQYRLVAGRDLTPEDREGAPRVGLVNQEAARRLWGEKSPVGRVLRLGGSDDAPQLTIVGVVGSGRHDGPNQPYKPELFVPFAQFRSRGFAVALEPANDPRAALEAFKVALRETDPLIPVGDVQPIGELLRGATASSRTSATLIGCFAGVALLLSMIGVYGVMAYVVAQRQRELGVRLALGATPGTIRGLVLSQGARLATWGAVIGLGLALALGRFLRALLFEVSASDPGTLVAVPLLLCLMVLLACWIPARRAVRMDPLVAIRAE
ncbi:MAG: ABC transporter permease [Gemmatimonadales bacterium]